MKTFEDEAEGITINDKLREALLVPESENYQAFPQELRNEFLFKVFQHLALGGSVCQYEDFIGAYVTQAKQMYRDLVSVSRNPRPM